MPRLSGFALLALAVAVRCTAALPSWLHNTLTTGAQPGAAQQKQGDLGASASANAFPVHVQFYGEALCPYCANLTANQVAHIMMDPGLSRIVHLEYVPYGNARTDANGTITCQHGPRECELNRLLSCAIGLNPLQQFWFPYLLCVERSAMAGADADLDQLNEECAVEAGVVGSRIVACHRGPLGDWLQSRAAQRTADLKPAHQWVPWLVVNGVPLLDYAEAVQQVVCAAYQGTKPAACFAAPAELGAAPPAAAAATGSGQAVACRHSSRQGQDAGRQPASR